MILKDSVNSSGGEEVVGTRAVVLVAIFDSETNPVTSRGPRVTIFDPLYAEMQGASVVINRRRIIFQCIAISEKKKQR